MASTWNTLKRMLGVALPASMAVLAIGNGMAFAQTETCPDETLDPNSLPVAGFKGYMPHDQAVHCQNTYGTPGNAATGCFRFDGSDTHTDLVEQSIRNSGACLTYHNVGSGQGETNLRYTAGDSVTGQTASQCLAPMSRNFTSAILDATTGVHPGWKPTPPDNIKALDAVVWSMKKKTGQAVDIEDFPPGVCQTECPNIGVMTYTNTATNPGDPPFTLTAAAVIMAGYPQSGQTHGPEGTTLECADPCRKCLLGWLASPSMEGVGHIEHIYRRDDKSGTQDTVREMYGFDRWCNGKGEGNSNKPGANLVNEDLDPIRRTCVAADSTHAQTRCTYYPSSQTCTAGSNDLHPGDAGFPVDHVTGQPLFSDAIKCSQGVLVTLSESDPGTIGDAVTSPDITQSIGMRVNNDGLGQSVGVAGFASYKAPSPPDAVLNVNTNTPTFADNVYLGAYKLSRRLFWQTPFGMTFSGSSGPCASTAHPPAAGAIVEEQKLWDYSEATECDPAAGTNVPGTPGTGYAAGVQAVGMEAIAIKVGFYQKWRPVAGCGTTSCLPASVSSTLTCLKPSFGVGTPKQNEGDDSTLNTCNASYPCAWNGATGTTCGGESVTVGTTTTNYCPLIGDKAHGACMPHKYGCNLNSLCCDSGDTCVDDGSGKGGDCCLPGTSC